MKKELFYDQMREALMELKPEEMEITFMKVDKQNRMGLHGCTLSMPESAASPTFYLEDLYEANRGGVTVKDIAKGVIDFAKENNLSMLPDGIDIGDYESIRKNLGLMVIGETANRDYLRDMVYEKIEDLALLPIVFINDSRSTGCIKIRKDLLAIWGVTAHEVMEEARKNAPKSMPPMFKQLGDILQENLDLGSEDVSIPEEAELFVVSNQFYAYGASVGFYPGFLESIAKVFKKDFFVLPSSVNELIILRDFGQNPLELLRIVTDVNKTQVAPEEKLADAVYYYSRSSGFRKILPMEAVLV